MIEQSIYFGLGVVVTGLLALGLMPILWARALRLTRHRLQAQIPVSMQEILADRDQLRAGFAVEKRKLEQEMERVRATKAGDMGELGRRATALFATGEELAAVRRIEQAQEREIQTLLREAAEAGAEIGGMQIALHDTHVYFERRLAAHQDLQRAYHDLEDKAEQQRTTVAALNTRAMGLEMTIEDAMRARTALERQLEIARSNAQVAAEERDVLSAQIGVVQAAHDALRKRLTTETSRAVAATEAHLTLQEEFGRLHARFEGLHHESAAAALAAQDREKSIHLQKSLQAEKMRGDARVKAEQFDVLNQENAALRGALEAARRHGGIVLPDAVTPETEAARDGDAMLRASIHELGLAVARMNRSDDDRDHPEATPTQSSVRLKEPEASWSGSPQ